MRRKTLVLGISGALAAAAVVGTAIGASAAEGERQGFGAVATTAPGAPTPGADPTGTPTGVPTATPSGTPSGAPSGSPAPTGSAPTGSAPAGAVDSARAVEIALASAGGGQLDEVEREQEHGRDVWSVEVVKDGWEIEVDVDAATGEIVKTDREQDDDNGKEDDDHDDEDDDSDDRDDDGDDD
ncbi:PepSY domain-containing protein [Micromonospora sp. WMMD1102]|uniref:PepSY domain-containing protein n=1 Tax=Micromonospora sp. WMMD1102 TaxID=3016105 RepID=UPI0024155612|nr:PepSY domain-containing protein [Micromonospora sp. WMMD1102]MDG4788721.1 PepSY domain-containing protein [Micromonospora sp. WMMD1102]